MTRLKRKSSKDFFECLNVCFYSGKEICRDAQMYESHQAFGDVESSSSKSLFPLPNESVMSCEASKNCLWQSVEMEEKVVLI